ncbi:uncharacterized protein LOC119186019 isoform X3 [Rhipicephalus microplus]|uniref:uncharacterized protein LOC119186019 isoform X3 n=1 Tax=Rhipicephalus microplus TaxID=6941 RepID=UPI003F6AA0DC
MGRRLRLETVHLVHAMDVPGDTASVSGGPSHHSNTAFAQQSAATWLANVRTWHTRVTVPQGRVQHPGLC